MPWYNDPEFKPKGNALKYWTLLPQTGTTFDNKEIPSLFGEIKVYVEISYVLIAFLVLSEIYVFTKVNEMGVDAGMIALFCFFDFLVVILPHFAYESSPDRLISIINANLYINGS